MAVVLSPFFFIGHIVALFLQKWGVSVAANGFSWPYEFFYSTGSVILGIAGIVYFHSEPQRPCSARFQQLLLLGEFGLHLHFFIISQ